MGNLIEKMKLLLTDEKKIKIVVIIGLIGMGLILASSFLGNGDKNVENASNIELEDITYDAEIEKYTIQMEAKLKNLLENIKGVGRVEVMLNLSGTKEYIYVDEEKINSSKNNENYSEQKENNYIIIENNGEKEALIKKINNPQVCGVVIVCEGGDNSVVRESIYNTVSVVFGLPANKIYVTKIK